MTSKVLSTLIGISALAVASASFTLGWQSPASAAFTLNLDASYNGVTPSGTPPWLTATFTDTGANQVTLQLDSKLSSTEFFSDIAFNLDPAFTNPSLLSFADGTQPSGSNIFAFDTIVTPTSQNQVAVQGLGNGNGFDFKISFSTSNANSGARRFGGTKSISYIITAPGLNENSFVFPNTPSTGSQFVGYSGAHVQGIPTGEGSGAIGTPVPEPLTLLGSGIALGFGGFLKRKAKQDKQG
jgi:hypothetical protein